MGGAVGMLQRGRGCQRQEREGRFPPGLRKGAVPWPLGNWVSRKRIWAPTFGLQLRVHFLVGRWAILGHRAQISALLGLPDKSLPLYGNPLQNEGGRFDLQYALQKVASGGSLLLAAGPVGRAVGGDAGTPVRNKSETPLQLWPQTSGPPRVGESGPSAGAVMQAADERG